MAGLTPSSSFPRTSTSPKSPNMPKVKSYPQILLHISDNLKKEEVSKLLFLRKDVVPPRNQESFEKDVLKFFSFMDNRAIYTEENHHVLLGDLECLSLFKLKNEVEKMFVELSSARLPASFSKMDIESPSCMSTVGSLRSTEPVAPWMGQPAQMMNVHPASQISNQSSRGPQRKRPVGSVQADSDGSPNQKQRIHQPIDKPPTNAKSPTTSGQVGSGHVGTVGQNLEHPSDDGSIQPRSPPSSIQEIAKSPTTSGQVGSGHVGTVGQNLEHPSDDGSIQSRSPPSSIQEIAKSPTTSGQVGSGHVGAVGQNLEHPSDDGSIQPRSPSSSIQEIAKSPTTSGQVGSGHVGAVGHNLEHPSDDGSIQPRSPLSSIQEIDRIGSLKSNLHQQPLNLQPENAWPESTTSTQSDKKSPQHSKTRPSLLVSNTSVLSTTSGMHTLSSTQSMNIKECEENILINKETGNMSVDDIDKLFSPKDSLKDGITLMHRPDSDDVEDVTEDLSRMDLEHSAPLNKEKREEEKEKDDEDEKEKCEKEFESKKEEEEQEAKIEYDPTTGIEKTLYEKMKEHPESLSQEEHDLIKKQIMQHLQKKKNPMKKNEPELPFDPEGMLSEYQKEMGVLRLDARSLPFAGGQVGSSHASAVDDTDNNEGTDDQLTSLKHDSGSNWDDISFGGLSAPPEILARGPRARRAYAEAARDGTKKVFRTRLMLVGQERVGKTSLKKTLTGQGFDQNEVITDGVETKTACEICIEVAKADEKMWSIHKKGHGNEDTKEDEYSKALADEIAKKLIVTPPQDQESLEPHSYTTLGRGLNPVEAEDENEIPVAQNLTVTPLTQQPDQESLEPHSYTTLGGDLNPVEREEFVLNNVEKRLKEQVRLKEIGLTDSTDSGRGEGVSLCIWDFAGQDIYYTTHQVFLTWRAIYVIVFDLSKSLDSVVPPEFRDKNYEMAKGGAKSELTCLEFISFWLCSIFAYAVAPSSVRNKNSSKTAQKSPPIFIVGTHRESVKGDAKEKNKTIKSAFEKIRKSVKKKPFECHVVPKYYAIENSLEDKDEELVALRRHIEEVAMEEPYMGEEIPHRWLLFEKALAAEKINHMSLDQTKELTQAFGIEPERELITMLTFYHDLGYVVYYGGNEDQQSLLRDMVILNPQWLTNVFKKVITILDPDERDRNMSDAWTTLEEDGILEDKLIQHMWQKFSEQKEFLVELMAKFDLICEAPVEQLQQEQQDGLDAEESNETEKVVKKRYYVPSRITSHCSREEIGQIKSSSDFYVDFRGFLPDGLFHRLMTRAGRWMGERDGEPVNLFYRHISLMVDEVHHALLEMLPPCEATIKVTVFRGAVADSDDDGDSHKPPAPSAVKEVMDFVKRTLDSLRQHWAERIKYDFCFLCPKCSKKKPFQDCLKRKSLQCGLHSIPTAAVKSKFGMSEEGVESGNESPMMCRSSSEAATGTGQAGRSATLSEQQRTQIKKGSTNAINASGASNVSGNTMIGQQTNVHNSTPITVVHHHHITTNVTPASS